jgi:pantoate--beta-alanine ligase
MSTVAVETIGAMRERIAAARAEGRTIGLVPTMGALHAGHVRLIERARPECGCVVASLFVNPTQFNRGEDFANYPRTLEHDLAVCNEQGVDYLFLPSVEEMYAVPQRSFVEVEKVSEQLCGKFRPGHFRGVATVVLKLFNIIQADRAYFGEKDAQQLALIRRMVHDLNVPIEIVGVETVREADGLALSSRNQRLNAAERQAALVLSRALNAAREMIRRGETDCQIIRESAIREFEAEPLVKLEYFEVAEPDEMQPLTTVAGPVRVATAAWVGGVRLIDNVGAP